MEVILDRTVSHWGITSQREYRPQNDDICSISNCQLL